MIIGLTGNYGMGKSTVLKMFASLGAHVIDSDKIVEKLLESADILRDIEAIFGKDVFAPTGKLLKERVSDIIFTDDEKRKRLEALLHPLVFKEIERLLEGKKGVIVIEVPLLFEGGFKDRFHKTITVFTTEEEALKRLSAMGIKREDALKRLSCQMPISEKIKQSDFVIDNSSGIEDTYLKVRAIYEEIKRYDSDKRA